MSSKQDNTTTGAGEAEGVTQLGIRVPVSLAKTVAKQAIDRDTTAQQLWIEAMRAYLKGAA